MRQGAAVDSTTQQGYALDVVSHRERIEGTQLGQRVASLGEGREVAGQRSRIARHVHHPLWRAFRDEIDDGASGSFARRIQHHHAWGTVMPNGIGGVV